MDGLRKVEVVFEDHFSLGEEWYEMGTKHDVCILSCLGYLVDEDSRYYYVANTYEKETKNYQAGTAILKSCVIGFTEYGNTTDDTPKRKQRLAR